MGLEYICVEVVGRKARLLRPPQSDSADVGQETGAANNGWRLAIKWRPKHPKAICWVFNIRRGRWNKKWSRRLRTDGVYHCGPEIGAILIADSSHCTSLHRKDSESSISIPRHHEIRTVGKLREVIAQRLDALEERAKYRRSA